MSLLGKARFRPCFAVSWTDNAYPPCRAKGALAGYGSTYTAPFWIGACEFILGRPRYCLAADRFALKDGGLARLAAESFRGQCSRFAA